MKLLKIKEVADRIGLTPREVYKYIEMGEIPVVVLGEKRGMRILEKDVECFTKENVRRYLQGTSAPKLKASKKEEKKSN